jgi:hypothetical protein
VGIRALSSRFSPEHGKKKTDYNTKGRDRELWPKRGGTKFTELREKGIWGYRP